MQNDYKDENGCAFEEDSFRFKSLDDYDKYDEREFEKRMLKIKIEEVRKEAIRRLQEGI